MKPAGYPLPWCDALDTPYWWINFVLCSAREGWAKWQSKLSMAEIIPEIDKLIISAPSSALPFAEGITTDPVEGGVSQGGAA